MKANVLGLSITTKLDRMLRSALDAMGGLVKLVTGHIAVRSPVDAKPDAAALDRFGVDGAPIRVEVVSTRDIADGVTARQTKQAARPLSGTIGLDPRMTPDLGLLGGGP